MITLKVKKDRTGPITGRHPWLFSGALYGVPEGIEPGTPVRLESPDEKYLASGYFNSHSQIAVRIWGHDEHEEVDAEFFVRRIRRAFNIRKSLVENPGTDSFRVVNGENDLLPGLIVDMYAGYLAVQFHTRGIEHWRQEISAALIEVIAPRGIYERSEAGSRRVEGLGSHAGILYGDVPDVVTIKENGFTFLIDIKGGQKTGFFLDQRDKRAAVVKYSSGRAVLNAFSYTGGFCVYALSGGAKSVVNVDTSKNALDMARENIKINGLDPGRCEFVCEDVKKYIKDIKHGDFNLIVLDPPAFIKDRKKKNEGLVGYKKINDTAVSVLDSGGVLVTCSCSNHLSMGDFRYLLSESGGKAGKTLQILESFTGSVDHPVLAANIEGDYLKVFFIRVV